jgi:hypothetical protein
MPPVYHYRYPGDSGTTDISEYFELYTLDCSMNAEEGSIAQTTFPADDPLATLDIVGHRTFNVTESLASGSNTRIYSGYTAERRVSRGDWRADASRVWAIDVIDVNTILGRRVMRGSDCKRPAETDVARVQWLASTAELGEIDDTRYLNTSGAVAMDKVDYTGQRAQDVLDDCAQQSGKNYFVWFADDVGQYSLWYDFAASESYSSPLRISNDLADVDSVWTFPPSNDTELKRSPDRVNSGAYLPYDGGVAYVESIATYNAFVRRDAIMPASNVKTQGRAQARATRYLGEMDTEEDVITTTITVPAASVNLLMQGMRVQFKAVHLPGYEDFVWVRALNRSVVQVSEEFYTIKLELGAGEIPPVTPSGNGEARMYEPDNVYAGVRSTQIKFHSSGDDPSPGYPAVPTTSPFTKTGSPGEYTGYTIGNTGTIDITWTCTSAEVFGAGTKTIYFNLLKNGGAIATGSATRTFSGLTYWSATVTTTATGLAVTAGDTLTFSITGDLSASGKIPIVPAGSGSLSNVVYLSGTF